MSGQGVTTIDFGAFPGKSDTTKAVSAAGVSGHPTSIAEAWLIPVDTADHLADEHWLESISVMAGPCVAGVGFTVYAKNTSELFEPMVQVGGNRSSGLAVGGTVAPNSNLQGGIGTRLYGTWTIGYAWN